jgi:tyrosinase
MKAWSAANPADPRGWTFQANIHGTYTVPAAPTWNQCQHGSYFFLSWHRMYLYYFERIARAASGNNNFTLPYWNYSNIVQAALPAEFRDPGNADLYVASRNAGVNAGHDLSPFVTDFSDAFALIPFIGTYFDPDNPGFGGAAVPAPAQFLGVTGMLEMQPHNVVHDAIGGLMGDPHTAARDPIFWLHHANIDRLWVNWLAQGGGRDNPGDALWLNQQFTFYDENGNAVQMTGAQVVDTAAQLNYVYDDAPEAQLLGAAAAPQPTLLAKSTQTGIPLGGRPITVGLPVDRDVATMKFGPLKAAAIPRRVVLSLEEITFDAPPGTSYEIYLNLPEGSTDGRRSPHYVGVLSFFGLFGHGVAGHKHEAGPPTVRYDVTKLAAYLQTAGQWDPKNVRVTLVPIVPVTAGGKALKAVEFVPAGNPKIGSVRLVVEPVPDGAQSEKK